MNYYRREIDTGTHLFSRYIWTVEGKYAFAEHVGKYTEYWLNGHGETRQDVVDLLHDLHLDAGKYQPMEEFYGDGFFPACYTLEDAKAYFGATRKEQK